MCGSPGMMSEATVLAREHDLQPVRQAPRVHHRAHKPTYPVYDVPETHGNCIDPMLIQCLAMQIPGRSAEALLLTYARASQDQANGPVLYSAR